MAVPTLDELHQPVLNIVNDASQRLTRQQILQTLVSLFSLSDDDLQEMVPSGGQSRIENRTNWAITDLKKAGLLNNPQRNQWEITPSGRNYLTDHQGLIRLAELEALWSETVNKSECRDCTKLDVSEVTPDEHMEKSYREHQERLADEILDSVKTVSPQSFERLGSVNIHNS